MSKENSETDIVVAEEEKVSREKTIRQEKSRTSIQSAQEVEENNVVQELVNSKPDEEIEKSGEVDNIKELDSAIEAEEQETSRNVTPPPIGEDENKDDSTKSRGKTP